METIRTKYLGELRTEAEHLKSGQRVITDAPLDNQGKGEAFSPSDLMTASLSSCMLTIMAIAAKTHDIPFENISCKVTKVMFPNPRRVGEIILEFEMGSVIFTDKQKAILTNAAHTCPVALAFIQI